MISEGVHEPSLPNFSNRISYILSFLQMAAGLEPAYKFDNIQSSLSIFCFCNP